MNIKEALTLDTDFYAENDIDYGWGVFGNNSGFCYLLSDRATCEQEADRLYQGVPLDNKVFSPEESLANYIANDTRNLNTWEARFDHYKFARLPDLVADCAIRWTEATKLSEQLAVTAEANLRRAVKLLVDNKPIRPF